MYQEILPSNNLRPFIECYWIRKVDSQENNSHRVLPDGCIDFVFDFKNLNGGLVVGTMTESLNVKGSQAANFLGVRFRPGKIRNFVRFQASDITDLILPIEEIAGEKGRLLTEKLEEAPNDQITILDSVLGKWIQEDKDFSLRLNFAVDNILKTHGSARIESICASLGITRQYLGRIFQESLGISPKQFSRIVRFQALVRKLHQSLEIDWAQEAIVSGYYDQAHLISDFREFAGITPNKYQLNS